MTKEELQGTLESHKQRMDEITPSKLKTDVDLQSHSNEKYNGRWNGNNGRGSQNNSNGRGTHQEGSSSNQRQYLNQGNHRGGGAGKGRGDRRNLIKVIFNAKIVNKYGHYASQCRGGKKDQESGAKLAEGEVMLMVTVKE